MHTPMFFLAGVALIVTALATPLATRGTFPDVPNGFNVYCPQLLPYDQQGDTLTYLASCAASDARSQGTKLSQSTININDCLANDDGVITGRAHGGALGSCDCDFGTHVCGLSEGCLTTTAQCTCKTNAGTDHVNRFDISEYIGVGFDHDNHFVLYCFGIHGAWNQCVVDGAATPC